MISKEYIKSIIHGLLIWTQRTFLKNLIKPILIF
jgi:hypothetical protein